MKILLLSLCLVVFFVPNVHAGWSVCITGTRLVAASEGKAIRCNKCVMGIPPKGIRTPRNCKRFVRYEAAAEYYRQVCDCD
jgi:hypothetical protein